MFKKAFKISAYNSIAGKDKKKLKKDVQKIFNSEVIEQIFNNELNDKIYQNKIQGSKIVIYSNEKYPVFVDATSKGDYFPSLYLVFAYPDLIEGVEINPGVESFLAKGANLMWPGVKAPHELGEFKKDDVRYIVDSNENIIGLGALGSSSKDIKDGMQGIALYILHTLGDKLWEFGPKAIPPIALQPKGTKLGFGKVQEVLTLPQEEEKKEEEEKKPEVKKKPKGKKKKPKKQKEEEDDEEEDEDDNFEGLMQFASKAKQLQSTGGPELKTDSALDQLLKQKKEKESQQQQSKEEVSVKKEKGKGGKEEKVSEDEGEKKKGKGKKKGKQEDEEAKGEMPTKIMDEYVYEAFMNALKVSISDKDLPIDSSAFYSSHMLQCKREGVMIDLKCSSYKKIGKFFQVMGKQGLIDYKEAKKGTQPMIMKINRGNLKLEKWEPTIAKTGKRNEEGEEKKGAADSEAFKLQITDLFKPKKDSFSKLFVSEKDHYTREEIKNAVLQYIKANEDLCKVEKQFIVLDPYLISQMQIAMDNEENEQPNEEEDEEKKQDLDPEQEDESQQQQAQSKKRKHKKQVAKVTREEICEKVERSMLPYHKISNLTTKREDIKAGAFKGISLTTEKAHNKNITRVVGLETYGFNPQNLANKFQLKFATAVSLHDLPGKTSPGKEMIVQGNVLQDLIDFFTQECSIERKHINLNDKLGKKSKKKKEGYQI